MAQSDLRTLLTHSCVTSGDAAREHQNRLVIELGTIQVTEKAAPYYEPRDQAAFDELKSMQ